MTAFQNQRTVRAVLFFLVFFLLPACSIKTGGSPRIAGSPRCKGAAVVQDSKEAQNRIDAAMGFYQASIEFWEQGELERAIETLDRAYALILDIETDPDSDIYQQREDLRVTVARRIVEVYASRVRVVNGYQAIPLVMNEHIERQIKSFQGRERDFFISSYVRSGRYRAAILEALKEEGLPPELSWLPLIESGFKVRALSPARALGMWQFIPSTGYKFGLQRNAWIDERMDPEKSTLAAIAYLKELHSLFGDWTTALAAYNCGEGRVLRTISTQKVQYLDDFWDLYMRLPRETAAYVPRFLAVLHIINDPAKYGFELPPVAEPETYERLTINRQLHLRTIAANIGYSLDDTRLLNPELRDDVTPPEPYGLKVPPGMVETLLAKLNDMPVYAAVPVERGIEHQVRKGETLSGIAGKYRMSAAAIMAANNLKNANVLRVGMRLKIPSGTTGPRVPERSVVTAKSLQLEEYVVRKGDSLWQIANRANTTTKAIQSVNNLITSRLSVGQVLRIPRADTLAQNTKTTKYQVKKGDTPYIIAERYKMNLAEFLGINNLTSGCTIFPGQTLQVMVQ
ncbi:MAG: LysM peptidoglycan-binding domain-containing protein [Deltaproteobacteria bacterium]|nr:LysM peptidoglycan-binding domain-containing protein [Deltaproteobacteria bacterium]